MTWTLPDKGEGVNDIQSVLFQEYLDVLLDGIDGLNCVLVGCEVTGAGADMTPEVSKGAVLSNNVMYAIAAATVTISAADATNPRLDLVVVTSAGSLAVRTGTPAALSSLKPPARTANDVVLAVVYVPANDTSISTNQITDMRVLRRTGPLCIYRTTTAETTNTTAAAVHVLNKAGSGVTIPDGLFLSGRQLRCRIGGNMLLNSGTPTVTLAIAYGGTTMFQDVTGTATADTDRLAWNLDFVINAQANNDQALVGGFGMSILGAKTAPTNGLGDIAGTAALVNAFAGSAAVDSNAGNRTLAVTLTMSVSNAANEIVTEFACLEII